MHAFFEFAVQIYRNVTSFYEITACTSPPAAAKQHAVCRGGRGVPACGPAGVPGAPKQVLRHMQQPERGLSRPGVPRPGWPMAIEFTAISQCVGGQPVPARAQPLGCPQCICMAQFVPKAHWHRCKGVSG